MTGVVDEMWLRRAIDLAQRCPASRTAYSVGAVIVLSGAELSCGWSRQSDPYTHAEEEALSRINSAVDLADATLYSSLEPCSERASKPTSCTQLVLASGIRRVVVAWREPALFVADCTGIEQLQSAGAKVIEYPALADLARAPSAHLLHDRATDCPQEASHKRPP